jgi:hypothetical protein
MVGARKFPLQTNGLADSSDHFGRSRLIPALDRLLFPGTLDQQTVRQSPAALLIPGLLAVIRGRGGALVRLFRITATDSVSRPARMAAGFGPKGEPGGHEQL